MAIKVRCQQCRKKISIDEAFAGGNCRCPYCKAITTVSGKSSVSRGGRPDRPGRPDAPTTAEPQVQPVEVTEAIPLAKPVKIQGIVTLVLSVFVLVLLVVGWFLVVKLTTDEPPVPKPAQNGTNGTETPFDDDDRPPMPNPFTIKGFNVVGMTITGPVVYVVDGSFGLRDLYNPIEAVVQYSILTMGAGEKFNIIVLDAEMVEPLADKWVASGNTGYEKAKQYLMDCQPEGTTGLAGGIRRAIAMKPKTIVVLTCTPVDDAEKLAKQAKQAGIDIFVVAVDLPPDTVEAIKKLATGTSGKCLQFESDNLTELILEAEPLP